MRDRLRELLAATVPEVVIDAGPPLNARIFEPHGMTTEDGLPALIVRQLPPSADRAGHAGPTTRWEIWIYTERERFTDIDALEPKVKAALDQKVWEHNGKRYYSEHQTSGIDTLDQQFGGITRTVSFDISDLAFLEAGTYEPDPVAALRSWVEARWPNGNPAGDIQTDPTTWIPSEQSPGIYWRHAGDARIVEHYPTWTLLEARFVGHVLSPSRPTRLDWTRRLAEAIAVDRRTHMSDGAPVDFISYTTNPDAHPINDGQVVVVAQYGVLKPATPADPLTHVHVGGDVPPQEVT